MSGLDQKLYPETARFERRTLASVVDEFAAVRAADAAGFAFRVAVGKGSITARALAYLIAGHERHHQQLLRERYMPCLPDVEAPGHRGGGAMPLAAEQREVARRRGG